MASSDITLTLIGGPTLLIEYRGFRLLTDPTFDDPGTYQSGAITLRKLEGPALSLEDVGRIDAVFLSHDQHFDNLDHRNDQGIHDADGRPAPGPANGGSRSLAKHCD